MAWRTISGAMPIGHSSQPLAATSSAHSQAHRQRQLHARPTGCGSTLPSVRRRSPAKSSNRCPSASLRTESAKKKNTAEPRLTAASAVGPTRPIMAMSTKFMDIHPTSPITMGTARRSSGAISRRIWRQPDHRCFRSSDAAKGLRGGGGLHFSRAQRPERPSIGPYPPGVSNEYPGLVASAPVG